MCFPFEYRLLQNRVSAQRFRQKRKNEFEQLKDDLREAKDENEQLRGQVGANRCFLFASISFLKFNLRAHFQLSTIDTVVRSHVLNPDSKRRLCWAVSAHILFSNTITIFEQ